MNQGITKANEDILYWMLDYIDEGEDDYDERGEEPPYKKADVDEFESIIDNFITTVASSREKSNFQWVKNEVKDLVITLNSFNCRYNQQMIETGQREGICDLIDLVIKEAGHSVKQDITLEWRDW